ncbi:MAG TPA: hypothetical protein VGP93_15940 [Polyangiaceae bacterium]|nr:hypothetical protein [Polyangiaceae bacterium]
MSKNLARVFGASAAVLVAASFVAWKRLRPPPCSGGVFIEFRPPLAAPGPYRFRVDLDGDSGICEFEASPDATAHKTQCKMPLEVRARDQDGRKTIIGVTIGAAPERLRLQVKQGSEAIYDTSLEPKYTPWATRRAENKRFCGDRALVKPVCLRGSSQCIPFPASCDGPEDCPAHDVCCASPEWGREYGVKAATECSSRRDCLDRFARVACHDDKDCGDSVRCDDLSVATDFTPLIKACAAPASQR